MSTTRGRLRDEEGLFDSFVQKKTHERLVSVGYAIVSYPSITFPCLLVDLIEAEQCLLYSKLFL